MDTSSRESYLVQVMTSGFQRAATAFAKLINKNVRIVNTQSVLMHDHDVTGITDEEGELSILITQLIGDISGKSFLIINQEERLEIFKALNTPVVNEALNEAFLLEIDNIISASVIAELSNYFKLEVYGDVPRMIKVDARDLRTFIAREMHTEEPSKMLFCNTVFLFDGGDKIHPQFIWKLSNKLFDKVPTAKTSA